MNHINGNKEDNRLENLEWCTPSEDCIHAYKTGLNPIRHGLEIPTAKIKEEDVHWIRLNHEKVGITEMAKKFKLNCSTINNILKGITWSHLKTEGWEPIKVDPKKTYLYRKGYEDGKKASREEAMKIPDDETHCTRCGHEHHI